MSNEILGRPRLSIIQGGSDLPIVRRVKLSDEILGIKNEELPLPEYLDTDKFRLGVPERHEAISFGNIGIFHLKLELTNAFTTSFGTIKDKDVILVVLKTKDGLEGVGECSVNPNPDYSEESAQTVLTVLDKHLIPSLKNGKQVTSVEDLVAAYRNIKGNFAAKAGVEAAYWDLLSRMKNIPLHQFWGGRQPHALTGVSVGARTVEELLPRVDKAVERGFPRIKLKIWPGFDIEPVNAVRSRYPDLPLQVDANSAYTTDDIDIFKELDKYGLILIEQPFTSYDLLDHARLQRQIATPICLDESLKTVTNVRQAIELWSHIGKLSSLIINIKPPRVGGYWEAVKIADLCQAAGVRAWCGGMLDTSWTKRMNIQLSSHPAFILPGDHAQQEPYYVEDISPAPLMGEHGVIPVSRLSQNHEELDWKVVKAKTVASSEYSLRD
ncbi:MAG: o-succinylbenzoate synthase [Patescibacteria group bacterium]|nr:o-succinylbenzoate synthase [Patescibacteria group bacterium]